ncbi:TrbG/VirB9 family P-type conjugative transfer protein, partial [Burkholderia multivorans]|uniref:TrbG/VirB9 family P-type conjugative transfer protein n=1 Tax=Burkholderia multivorans TaxID=87883 RepID=UPI001C251D9F
APPPAGGPAGPAGTYNFGWTVTGADQAKPTQVFDDGARIYVQFSDMKHVPAIFTETSSGRVLMSWELQFPYAVLTRPAQTLIFQLGPFEARAQRGATGATAAAGAEAGTGGTPRPAAATVATGQAPAPAAKPAAGATPAKRAASTDALWYLNTGSPSTPAANTAAAPAPAATTPSAVTSSAAPAAASPQQPAAPSPRSRASADALWYISQ